MILKDYLNDIYLSIDEAQLFRIVTMFTYI